MAGMGLWHIMLDYGNNTHSGGMAWFWKRLLN